MSCRRMSLSLALFSALSGGAVAAPAPPTETKNVAITRATPSVLAVFSEEITTLIVKATTPAPDTLNPGIVVSRPAAVLRGVTAPGATVTYTGTTMTTPILSWTVARMPGTIKGPGGGGGGGAPPPPVAYRIIAEEAAVDILTFTITAIGTARQHRWNATGTGGQYFFRVNLTLTDTGGGSDTANPQVVPATPAVPTNWHSIGNVYIGSPLSLATLTAVYTPGATGATASDIFRNVLVP